MKEQIIEILKQFEQTDYKKGGVSLAPEMYNAVAESIVKLFATSDVSGQSELLIAFADWVFNQPKHLGGRERELVAEYLKAINCH